MNASRAFAAAAVFTALVVGCSSDDPAPEQRSAQEPISVLPADPTGAARQALRDPDSSARTVLDLWNHLKFGAVPVAASAYAPSVTESVGASALSGTLAALQGTVAPYELQIMDVESTAVGSLVLVRGVAKNAPEVEHAYLLRRVGDRWAIVYDSLVAGNIEALVTRQEAALDGDVEQASRRARSAGAQAAQSFRAAGLDIGSGP